MITPHYIEAFCFLVVLLVVFGVGIFYLKKFQGKWQSSKNCLIEEGIFIDAKHRIVILNIDNNRYLYAMGPHNDHLLPLNAAKNPTKDPQDAA